MDFHTEDGDYNDDLYSMQDGIDHTFGDSLFDDQHHGIDKNPIEDCYIYDYIDLDANVLGDISIEDKTLGVFDDNQSNDNHQHVIINGKQYWIPKAPDEVKPKLKGHYRSYEDITDMYYKYALAASFDVRKTTNGKNGHGIIRLRYLVCNRQGLPNTGHVDTLNPNRSKIKRKTDSRRTGCNACIRFRMIKGSSTCLSNQNVCATQAHRLFTAINGGYNIIGGTVDDFKILMRDLNCFIGGTDAQMLVDKMTNRTKNVPNFSFDFRVENKQLNAMFWADETSKINYKEFGDVVSFDATFRTNRYDMVFVPFTGIDNHKKCVTFGAGLHSKEDIDSYTWLLKSFLKAFGKQPILVSLDIVNDEEFKLLFNSLIWNTKLEEKDFEQGWQALLDEYDLNDNTWLSRMYNLRHSWIPAFFKRVPMSGLMRTTSRSESQNSVFHQNTHYGSTLVNFMNLFEFAMEKQRYTQSSLDFKKKTNSLK
ncbi:protein FAR1-RELATED SEQUENCE 5-like [Lactuca sativa]|uniref:protein FAR1-RELATED SEQUENCE 5-like n=1 Tax=Lactuca sativa TaxID=4236 RepID=UPI000CD993E9|nr:protein FAR1-RELATED SEQUENCE 5-like [Lactuca sativa]